MDGTCAGLKPVRGADVPPPEPVQVQPVLPALNVLPGMPRVVDPRNIRSEIGPAKLSEALRDDLHRICAPNLQSNHADVLNPALMKGVNRFKVGVGPQYIVPSSDPRTGEPGAAVKVDDPPNMFDLADHEVIGYLRPDLPILRFKEIKGGRRLQAGEAWEPGPTEIRRTAKACHQTSEARPLANAFTLPTCMPTVFT